MSSVKQQRERRTNTMNMRRETAVQCKEADEAVRAFLDRCCLIDIETDEQGRLFALGAVCGERRFSVRQGLAGSARLAELDDFGHDAQFLLGHNILDHDLPHLRSLAPNFPLLAKPVVDTLYLSPLAFPENPYHRLVKNYQVVRDSINDPVEDALLAGRVFGEQWRALVGQLARGSDAPLVYRGLAAALGAMGIPLLAGDDLIEVLAWLVEDAVCEEALQRLRDRMIDSQANLVALAYVASWLTVAGGNSVLPPWSWALRFPLGSVFALCKKDLIKTKW